MSFWTFKVVWIEKDADYVTVAALGIRNYLSNIAFTWIILRTDARKKLNDNRNYEELSCKMQVNFCDSKNFKTPYLSFLNVSFSNISSRLSVRLDKKAFI